MTGTSTLPAAGGLAICKICFFPLSEAEALQPCPACATLYHEECWQKLHACAVYGCREMYETKKPDAEDVTYWGVTEKRCAMCAETIPVGALTCPYCHAEFDDVRPMTREDVIQAPPDRPPTPLRRTAVFLLILSVAGLTSPLVLVGGGIWYVVKRRRIADEGPATRAIALIALAVAVVYAALFSVGAAVFSMSGGVK